MLQLAARLGRQYAGYIRNQWTIACGRCAKPFKTVRPGNQRLLWLHRMEFSIDDSRSATSSIAFGWCLAGAVSLKQISGARGIVAPPPRIQTR
jgi:hypothetical protein